MRCSPDCLVAGSRFGLWTVIGSAPNLGKNRAVLCRCDCGTQRPIRNTLLQCGRSYSCGCVRLPPGLSTYHKPSPEYAIWVAMRQRCSNPASQEYANYGGRGIAVCERWQSFAAFLADMGTPPSSEHQIDRIDNDGWYAPENCRWATPAEQNRNKRVNHLIEFNGRRQVLTDWAHEIGLHPESLRKRLARGWSVEEALTLPNERPALDPATGMFLRRGG